MNRLSILFCLVCCISLSCLQDPEVENSIPDAPTVRYDASTMTRISVLLDATFDTSIQDVEAVGFEINGINYGVENNNDNHFSFTASTNPGQEYIVRSYFSNGKFWRYSEAIKFKAPIESSPTISEVAYNDGILSASILDTGGRPITDVGFCIGAIDDIAAVQNGTRYSVKTENGTSFALDFPVEGFGEYYVVAYAENGYSKSPLGFSQNLLKVTRGANDCVKIEDPVFERYLVSQFDTNKDGKMSFTELEAITAILVSTDNIISVKEINLMPLLTKLYVSGIAKGYGYLSAIDVSANPQLTILKIDNNAIESLDLSGCPMLTTLSCAWNKLSEISITENPGLVSLDCHGTLISQLDVSANNKLEYLDCSSTPLEYLYLNPTQTIKTLILPDGAKVIYLINNLSIEPADVTVNVNETASLTAVFDPENTVNKDVIWISSDEEIATVSDEGIVSGIKSGKATITATFGLKSATCQVSVVTVPVTSISLDKPSLELIIGETATLQATTLPENATDKTVSWESSNTEIATVIDGNVTATGIGQCTITATAGDKTAECTITVLPIAVASITLVPSSYALPVGEKLTITPTIFPDNATDKTIVWSTSNPNVATITDGIVTAIGVGDCIIAASAGNKNAECAITVLPIAVASISLEPSSLALIIGEKRTITTTILPEDATDKTIVWSTSNPEVATVANGLVTAVNAGHCTITATSGNISTDCDLTVSVPVEGLTLSENAIKLDAGESRILSVILTPPSATYPVSWSSSDESIATVSEDGVVTGIGAGECEVIATIGDSTASCKVEISALVLINNTTFPDDNFRAYIQEVCDRNGDGYLSETEIWLSPYIDVSDRSIRSLEGISYFASELTQLKTLRNPLGSLDVSMLKRLHYIYCQASDLTSLNLGDLPELRGLYCSENYLTEIDVSGLPNLTNLHCYSNRLTSLDVSNLPNLLFFDCNFNQLTELDVSNLSNLLYLNCRSNKINELDVSNSSNLETLNCGENQLTSLKVSNLPNLKKLDCSFNELTALDLTNNIRLSTLDCSANLLTTLDIGALSSLTELGCSANQFTSLHISSLPNLTTLRCGDCKLLTTFSVDNLPNLTTLYCSYNNLLTSINLSNLSSLYELVCYKNRALTSLDVSTLPNLVELDCRECRLSSLDLGNMPNLVTLYCNNNKLSSLDASNHPNLTTLICDENGLSSLDVSNALNLKLLVCQFNRLTTIDLSSLTNLTSFSCYSNLLTSLDVHNNSKLTELYFGYNMIDKLDVSHLTGLTQLHCEHNQLSVLDISALTNLSVLECFGNQLRTLDVSNNNVLEKLLCHQNPQLEVLWLKRGQQIKEFKYDNTTTIYYKD